MGAFKEIVVKQITSTDTIKRLFEMHVDKAKLEGYRLPVKSPDTHVIVGLSGGADSSILALFAAAYLAPIYRNLTFLFTTPSTSLQVAWKRWTRSRTSPASR